MRCGWLKRMSLWVALAGWSPWWAVAADPEVLRPRVPHDQIETTRNLKNPLPASPENVSQGRALFHGKGFCASCHGRDGRGLGNIPGLRGKLPRDFTDTAWQKKRTDGELMWILKHGSPGTDMAPFIPLVLTEEEAWQVILYVRSFGSTIASRSPVLPRHAPPALP